MNASSRDSKTKPLAHELSDDQYPVIQRGQEVQQLRLSSDEKQLFGSG